MVPIPILPASVTTTSVPAGRVLVPFDRVLSSVREPEVLFSHSPESGAFIHLVPLTVVEKICPFVPVLPLLSLRLPVICALPLTVRVSAGVVVPIPILPASVTTTSVPAGRVLVPFDRVLSSARELDVLFLQRLVPTTPLVLKGSQLLPSHTLGMVLASVVSNQISPCIGADGAVFPSLTTLPVSCLVPFASMGVTRCAKANEAVKKSSISDKNNNACLE